MALQHGEILATARGILDRYGLADLSMRRLAAELGVQPSALYWHVDSKQALLAQLADALLAEVPEPSPRRRWDRRLHDQAVAMRHTLLQQRDGAEVVSAGHASSLGTSDLGKQITGIIESGGHSHEHACAARDALLHFVLGFTLDEQTHATMAAHGAAPARVHDDDARFEAALAVVIAGVRA